MVTKNVPLMSWKMGVAEGVSALPPANVCVPKPACIEMATELDEPETGDRTATG